MVAIYSQMLRKKFASKLGPDGDEYIGYTVQGANQMEQLVKDLLAYTRASALAGEGPGIIDGNEARDKALGNLEAAISGSGAAAHR